jgi:hypothetical protein
MNNLGGVLYDVVSFCLVLKLDKTKKMNAKEDERIGANTSELSLRFSKPFLQFLILSF